jgi:FG-GAP-like repeat
VNIIVSYDSSVTSQSGAFQSLFDGAVNAAVQFYDQEFTNNITVNVTFAWQSLGAGALAENQFYYNTYSYATIVSALKATQSSTDDIAAYTTLPANDPTGGSGNDFMLTAAQARVLGLSFGAVPFDDFVMLNSDFGASGYTFDPNNRAVSGKYDAIGALEHEISEGIFGRIGNLGLSVNGASGIYTPLDLFRYSSSGVRDFNPGHNDFFSIDGQHLLTEFNNHNQFGGDVSDWYPTVQGDSFGDGYQGVMGAVTPTDLRELDILGWNLAGAAQSVPLTLRFVGSGDFTAGGLAGLAWQDGDGAALWTSNGSTLTQAVVPNAAMGAEWTAYGVGDFNGDGNADLLWTSNRQVAIWEMNGANLAGFGVSAGQMGAEWQVAGIGDFNGDAKSDILWVNTNGQAAVWTMNGTALAGFAMSNGSMGGEWHVAAIGDFNQDGRSDVLWENTSGNVDIWEMNGANLSGFVQNVGQMSAGWKIAGVGHFNGAADSTSDIVWVDSSNHVRIWQMNNGHTANVITPNGLDGTEWHLEGVGNFAGDANSDLLWINDSGAVDLWKINGNQVSAMSMNAPTGDTLTLNSSAGGTTVQATGGAETAVQLQTNTDSTSNASGAPTAGPSLLYSDSSVVNGTPIQSLFGGAAAGDPAQVAMIRGQTVA